MGVGLAICQTIIQADRGHIGAENNPDRGATVRFTLRSSRLGEEESRMTHNATSAQAARQRPASER
jgi:K+-sensing histidine kinase KdpD